ncbi:MAG: hypothetical protein ACM3UT_07005 [Chloroflexota bacterium]
MSTSFLRAVKGVVFSLCLFFPAIEPEAQVLKDTATLNLVKTTVDQIYGMNFTEADESTRRISTKYPDHPVVFLLQGLQIYWKNYPLLSGSAPGKDFERQMHLCIEKCDSYDAENEAEFLLASMCARGSLLAFYAGNDLTSKVYSLGSSSYRYLRRSFEFTEIFPDFLFFTGLYNYYREAYPEAHPGYKPLLAVFPAGDKEKGMYELRLAFKQSIFMKAEASTFLSSNYKYFENDYINASYFSTLIFRVYPLNIVYRINCIEDLLLTGKYNEAEKLILSAGSKTDNDYFMSQIMILTGILYEKKYSDMSRAEQEYQEGAEKISEFGNYGDQYAAYAYFGLSRISGLENDRQNQRLYRRKALGLTDFENVNFD